MHRTRDRVGNTRVMELRSAQRLGDERIAALGAFASLDPFNECHSTELPESVRHSQANVRQPELRQDGLVWQLGNPIGDVLMQDPESRRQDGLVWCVTKLRIC